jgi:hypothetical protein
VSRRRVADLVDRDCVKSAAALFLQLSSYRNVWFTYITCSRQVPPRRLNQSAQKFSSGGFGGSAASEGRTCLMD